MDFVTIVKGISEYDHHMSLEDAYSHDYADRYLKESHFAHEHSFATVEQILDLLGIDYTIYFEGKIPRHLGGELVIVVGGEKTFLEASHAVRNSPIIGVNSDPKRKRCFYLSATADSLGYVIQNINKQPHTRVHRLQVTIDSYIQDLCLHDVLIANKQENTMSRYSIENSPLMVNKGLLLCTSSGSSARMLDEGGTLMDLEDSLIQYLPLGRKNIKSTYTNHLTLTSYSKELVAWIDGGQVCHEIPIRKNVDIKPGDSLCIVGKIRHEATK